jgi:hypothetical protein
MNKVIYLYITAGISKMKIKNVLLNKIKIVFFSVTALLFFHCSQIPPFDNFIYLLSESIIYKNEALFLRQLLTPQELTELKETRFNGNYQSYLKVNRGKFLKALKSNHFKQLFVSRISPGTEMTYYGIRVIEATKVYLQDKNNEEYHMRVLYVVLTKQGVYKLFLLD